MQLSVLHIFINHNYNGILRLEIVKEFHNLCIKSSMYKINTVQNDTLEIFQNNLESDPSNPNIIDIIPTSFVYSEIFQLPICEKIIEYFNGVIKSNTNEYYRLNLGTNLICTLNKIQMQRVYNFFNSFVMNFALLDSIYSIYLNILDVKCGRSNIESNKENKIEEKTVIEKTPIPVLTKSIEKDVVVKKEENIYTQILDYCINNNIKLYVIHHIFTYLKDLAAIKIKKENNVTILQLNSLYPPSSILLNDEYLLSSLNTLLSKSNINEELFNFNQKKIQESIYYYINNINNPQDSILLLILIFIYYTHLYRTIILKYPDFDVLSYFSSSIQQSALNFFLKDLKFEITDCFDYEEQKEKSDLESLITTISENYKHLIPVSQEDFADIVINNIDKELNNINKESKLLDNIVLSTKKIIDINVLISNQEIINKSNTQYLSIVDNTNYVIKNNKNLLLNYQRNIITKTYNYFKNYIENPSSVLLIKDEPKEVINLFDFFSKSISKLFSNSEDISTLNYYKILYSNLPSANKYNFNTYLYLIYNLIIPYYVDVHKVTQFVDYFL